MNSLLILWGLLAVVVAAPSVSGEEAETTIAKGPDAASILSRGLAAHVAGRAVELSSDGQVGSVSCRQAVDTLAEDVAPDCTLIKQRREAAENWKWEGENHKNISYR